MVISNKKRDKEETPAARRKAGAPGHGVRGLRETRQKNE